VHVLFSGFGVNTQFTLNSTGAEAFEVRGMRPVYPGGSFKQGICRQGHNDA